MGYDTASVAIACLVVLVLVLAALRYFRRREPFFTEHGQEEPTRSYTPYTGTIPFGPWGTLPWAEAVPLARGGDYRCR